MSQLWMRDQSDSEWVVVPLDASAFALGAGDGQPVRACGEAVDADGAALLLRGGGPEGAAWLVMAGSRSGVRLNGAPLLTGIRLLQDRDELHVDGLGRVFFSTEQLASVHPFPGTDQPVFCPRCKQVVEMALPAVQCPQCKVWHHQSDELPCWTYTEHCALCDQPTDLDASYRWTPGEL